MLTFILLFTIFVILTVVATFLWSFRVAYKIYHPKRQVTGKKPSDFGMKYKEFTTMTADGYAIKGWLCDPGNTERTIIMCHNIGASKEKFLSYGKFLYDSGYNVVLFDFRSHGESQLDRGAFKQAQKWAKDLDAIIAYSIKAVHPKSIGVMGFSFGAISSIYAANTNSSVKAIILDSGPPDELDDTLYRLYGRVSNAPYFIFESIFEITVKKMIGAKHYPTVVLEGLKNLSPKAIFFIHGDRDNIIPSKSSEMLFNEYAKEPKELWLVPGSHHLTNYRLYKKEYESRVKRFFSKHL